MLRAEQAEFFVVVRPLIKDGEIVCGLCSTGSEKVLCQVSQDPHREAKRRVSSVEWHGPTLGTGN